MKPSEYLDAFKDVTGITSDYALAQRLEIKNGWIPAIKRGERNIPLEMAFKIAIALQLDPSQVIADLESQREKNEKRAEFWRGFLSRANTAAAVMCTPLSTFTGDAANALAVSGGGEWTSAVWDGLQAAVVRIICIM